MRSVSACRLSNTAICAFALLTYFAWTALLPAQAVRPQAVRPQAVRTKVAQVSEASETELDLLKGLSEVPGLIASFREEKQSPLLREPLTVEGTIWIAPPGVLLRETADPSSQLLIADRRVILIDEEGRNEFSLRDRAPAAAVGRFFFDLIAGDVESVVKRFEVELVEPPDAEGDWSILLSPKRRRRRSPVTKIVVRGRQNILRGLSLWDADDAETKISFYDVELTEQDPEALAARVSQR